MLARLHFASFMFTGLLPGSGEPELDVADPVAPVAADAAQPLPPPIADPAAATLVGAAAPLAEVSGGGGLKPRRCRPVSRVLPTSVTQLSVRIVALLMSPRRRCGDRRH